VTLLARADTLPLGRREYPLVETRVKRRGPGLGVAQVDDVISY
jgi:hypothetical protein